MAERSRTAIDPISVKIPEAVRLSGLSRSRIYELMKSGEIEFAKVGASTLIILDSLRQFIASRRAAGAEVER
jgi:excisionase family DNA binding protein